jgi:hypothetical protein
MLVEEGGRGSLVHPDFVISQGRKHIAFDRVELAGNKAHPEGVNDITDTYPSVIR